MPRAEPLFRRALAIDETSFGPDHPSVAIRLNSSTVRNPYAARLFRSMWLRHILAAGSGTHSTTSERKASTRNLGFLQCFP